MNLQLPSESGHGPGKLKPGKSKQLYPQNHLQALLDGFCDFSGVENSGLSFKGLSLNSKKVHEEFLFFACAGNQHGIAYAGDAINRGATCIVWEPSTEVDTMPEICVVKNKPDVPLIRVEALHEKVGEITARFYGHPSRAMNVIGVTGTNGKTSCTHFIAQLIHVMNSRNQCAVIGTLGNGFYGQLEDSSHTTPDAVTIQALLADFRDDQAETVVMEVSSHALAQGRVTGIEFDIAVFTNLTRDHLDYHGDMKSYAEEKLKLFQSPTLKQVVINIDDAFSSKIINDIQTKNMQAKILTCSRQDDKADYYARDITLGQEGLTFTLYLSDSKKYLINSHLVGDFNVDNLLASIAVVHQCGYDINSIISAISVLDTVPGRMEKVRVGAGSVEKETPLIVVDYAHTPDALDKGLLALRKHTQGKLYCIFGCGGDRDKGKRPLMAKVAETHSDHIMVTSDNPRTESGEQIIKEILEGFSHLDKVTIESDRELAIHKVLESAGAHDVLLIAGKGHEKYQEINGKHYPFSDKASVLSFYASGDEQ